MLCRLFILGLPPAKIKYLGIIDVSTVTRVAAQSIYSTIKVVVCVFIFRQCGVICAVAQTQKRLKIRHVHTSRQLPAPVSSLKEIE